MKKSVVSILLCCILGICCFTGCTGTGTENLSQVAPESGAKFDVDGNNTEGLAEPAVDESGEVTEEKQAAGSGTNQTQNKENTTNKINNEKLIYKCTLSVDTLDYQNSVKTFRELVKKYNGFLEQENESNDANYESYYYYDEVKKGKKHYNYSATVRIPSKDYNNFLDETGGIGEVRNKNANVTNISQQYYNLQAELEVLEAKYDRYLEMLKKAKTTNDIITIEGTITALETQINQIKTQLNNYDNDVAYSFVTISIKEVEKIEDVEQKGTVSNAFSDSWEKFAGVCHSLFIILLYLLPYILVLLAILVIVLLATRPARKRAKAARKARLEGATASQAQQTQSDDAVK
ncbi:MAG: DUF4349 domain-containing protein [Eubacterium sp.]|nr:DUF4349 domain-containing protein [Eubacterium sp.]